MSLTAADTSHERRSDILGSREERMNKVKGLWKKEKEAEESGVVRKKKMSARERRTYTTLIKVTESTHTQKHNRYVNTEKSEREKEKGSS